MSFALRRHRPSQHAAKCRHSLSTRCHTYW